MCGRQLQERCVPCAVLSFVGGVAGTSKNGLVKPLRLFADAARLAEPVQAPYKRYTLRPRSYQLPCCPAC